MARVYRINIWITIPPHENIVVSHQPSDDRGHEDVLGSIKDAFAAARRQIEALAKAITTSPRGGIGLAGYIAKCVHQ